MRSKDVSTGKKNKIIIMLHIRKSTHTQKKHLHVCVHAQTTHTYIYCIVNPQILYSEASREAKPLDGCLETGSSKALNAVFFSDSK